MIFDYRALRLSSGSVLLGECFSDWSVGVLVHNIPESWESWCIPRENVFRFVYFPVRESACCSLALPSSRESCWTPRRNIHPLGVLTGELPARWFIIGASPAVRSLASPSLVFFSSRTSSASIGGTLPDQGRRATQQSACWVVPRHGAAL
jgi:hypothetical protein